MESNFFLVYVLALFLFLRSIWQYFPIGGAFDEFWIRELISKESQFEKFYVMFKKRTGVFYWV